MVFSVRELEVACEDTSRKIGALQPSLHRYVEREDGTPVIQGAEITP